jgi:hypothetical protein
MGHTPGPWEQHGAAVTKTINFGRSYVIASCDSSGQPATEEIQANARLIASAPDLLAALKDVEEAWAGNGDMSMAVDAALLAIAKAEEV